MPLRNAAGEIDLGIGTATDWEEQKQLELALRRAEREATPAVTLLQVSRRRPRLVFVAAGPGETDAVGRCAVERPTTRLIGHPSTSGWTTPSASHQPSRVAVFTRGAAGEVEGAERSVPK